MLESYSMHTPDNVEDFGFLSRVNRICGFEYKPPMGLAENIKESSQIVSDVRNGWKFLSTL